MDYKVKHIPDEIVTYLNGEQLEKKSDVAMHFVTIDDNGYPYKAMVSVGEVLCLTETQIRIALWQKTNTVNYVMKSKKATLMVVIPPTAYDLQLDVTFLRYEEESALFEATVKNVKSDRAPYAQLTNGVQYQLKSAGQTIELWKKKLKLLKS
ncbi:hypothetical protein JCM19045_3262 [Bacillus sp. JCM 19045]|nr:hypothetical protein JCM19045_3262 [Bacillus sp. JCM 19045]